MRLSRNTINFTSITKTEKLYRSVKTPTVKDRKVRVDSM